MTIFLVHFALLLFVSNVTAQRLTGHALDRILATVLLFWGNIVVLCLLLSLLGRLNDPSWFFRTSLVLGLATFLVVRRFVSPDPMAAEPDRAKPSRWLLITAAATLVPILAANLAIAFTYTPNNYDSLTYHLPRVMYYLGHNSLAHFETADFRQVYYPFNFNLLQIFCVVYWAPLQSVNIFDVAAWVVAGLGVYRISRLCGCSANAALLAAWLTWTSTEILAQATSTILDLPAAAALACALGFALRWRQSQCGADAMLAGLSLSMSAGTKLTVAFFGPVMLLLFGLILYRHWRSGETRAFTAGIRAWIFPAIVATALCIPFLLYNIKATGEPMTHRMDFTLNKPFDIWCALQTGYGYLVQLFVEPLARFSFDPGVIKLMNQWCADHLFKYWNDAHAFSDLYTIPPDLNEDHVFYGFAGPLFLICAVWCYVRDPKLRRPLSWMGLLGLGWFITYFALNKWSLYNQRYFVPAIVVLGPCVAAAWDARGAGSRWAKLLWQWIFGFVLVSGIWFSGHYLLFNSIRPTPLPFTDFVANQGGPLLPPGIVERLPEQERVNVYSYGTNERIFPLMHLGPRQYFTSGLSVDPTKYNLFSFWGNTRNHIYSNLSYFASYTVVPVPSKRTAGVEFLGTVVEFADPFDYLGLPPDANHTPPSPENANIAVLIDYNSNTNDPVRIDGARVRAFGINPRDNADVRLSAEMPDGTIEQLLASANEQWNYISVKQPIKRLIIQVVSREDGRNLGNGEIPFTVKVDGEARPLTGKASTQFAMELITGKPSRNITVQGLNILEGPYPQWNLPRFRWAKDPVVRVEIPADEQRNRIRISFSVRLQVRDRAGLDVVHNGKVVQSFDLQGATVWHTQVVEFDASPGVNVIELKDHDATLDHGPDWLTYLEEYPDVKAYVLSKGEDLKEGAIRHYEASGKAEHRVLPMLGGDIPPPPRDSLYFAFRQLRVEGYTSQ